MPKSIAKKILAAESILLTTHREPDGDGLGSQFALYHGLKKMGKKVRILNVDQAASKYNFLTQNHPHQCYNSPHDELQKTDIAIVLDTNDKRLLEPLYDKMEKMCGEILFVDHHPVLQDGPSPTPNSLIDVNAASTGEVTYFILKELGIELDKNIAISLYTSIVFDTQIFRFIKNSPNSHKIAAELLEHEFNAGHIHRIIFGDFTKEKLKFVSKALSEIEYFHHDQIAFLKIHNSDLEELGLMIDDIRDLIDMVMNIESIEAAILVREDAVDEYKLSFRSKGRVAVLAIAESFGGGGHLFAAGAYVKKPLEEIREISVNHFEKQLKGPKMGQKSKKERLCFCNEIPREDVEKAIQEGADTLDKIFDRTTAGVGACGGSCRPKIFQLLESYKKDGTFPEKLITKKKSKKKRGA